jgi:ABC-type multidrug transport system ATPase subunit
MDEPTTALDMETRKRVMNSIRGAQQDLGKTILFTTHHLEDAENYADRVVILKDGRISMSGNVEDLTKDSDQLFLVISGPIQEYKERISTILQRFLLKN